jgi:hypothetical protein
MIAWHQPLHRGSEKAGNMILEKIGEYRREIGQRRIGQMERVGHPPTWMSFYVSRSACAGLLLARAPLPLSPRKPTPGLLGAAAREPAAQGRIFFLAYPAFSLRSVWDESQTYQVVICASTPRAALIP